MKVINIKNNSKYLKEYIRLCSIEWGSKKSKEENEKYVAQQAKKIINGDKVISILGLVNDNDLLGFISLFKYEDEITNELTPWYATMYVKEEYRGNGYSRILNDSIMKEAKNLGYKTIYLKTNLTDYYEKFNAEYIRNLENGEKLYCIKL